MRYKNKNLRVVFVPDNVFFINTPSRKEGAKVEVDSDEGKGREGKDCPRAVLCIS